MRETGRFEEDTECNASSLLHFKPCLILVIISRNRFALVKKLFDYAVLRLEREKAKQTDGTPSRSTFRSKDVDNQYPVSFSEFPPCLYFRMGGGEGYRTSHGLMYHGGQWLASTQFPPSCVQDLVLSIKRGRLRKMSNESVAENVQRETDNAWVDGRVDPIALREEDRSDGREGADKCNFVEFEVKCSDFLVLCGTCPSCLPCSNLIFVHFRWLLQSIHCPVFIQSFFSVN